jgi:hypothetical protein
MPTSRASEGARARSAERGGAAAPARDGALPPHPVLRLQQQAGNAAVARLLAAGAVAQRQPAPAAVDAEVTPQADKPEEDFSPKTGTKVTELKGASGVFKVTHGLTKAPSKAGFGEYSMLIEMTPNKSVGTSEIGFVQVSRQGKPSGGWATEKTDEYMTEDKAWRTEKKGGWRVDRADAKGDKTPFYGMFKNDKGQIKQYSTAAVGKFGGGVAKLSDTPGVGDPDKMEFTATVMDMKSGVEHGAVSWGYEFNSKAKAWTEETPALVATGSDRMQGRDRAIDKWNADVATGASGIDKVPRPPSPK